tara:strand:+ start:104 stop:319 length:216 start_codon:yes stop_codon:yes gene_type:complete
VTQPGGLQIRGVDVTGKQGLGVSGDGITAGRVSFLTTLAPILGERSRESMITAPSLVLTHHLQTEGGDVGI